MSTCIVHEDEAEITRLYAEERASCREIGHHFGISERAVRRIVLSAGVMRPRGHRLVTPAPVIGTRIQPEDEVEVLRLYTEERMTCLDIGRRLGVGEKAIRSIVLPAGVMRPQGRSSPGATDELRREASRLFHVEGVKNRAKIARMLGIAYTVVHRAVDLCLHLHEDNVG